jgi:Filamin/ABP280 repeat
MITTAATIITGRTEARSRSLRLFVAAVIAICPILAACGGDNLLLPKDGEPAKISVETGDHQTAGVGQQLTVPLSAKVTDPTGRAVQGAQVLFVPPPGGIVDPADTIRTGPDGVASASYTLSTTAGDQVVEARAPAIQSPTGASVAFHLTAMPEPAESLIPVGGDSQSVQVLLPLPDSLVVQAVDRFGNGVPGIEITWEAKNGGKVSPETATTGADGRAAAQRMLGGDPGPYVTIARAQDLAGSPIAFTATGSAPPRPELVLTAQPSSPAAAGEPFDRQPELQLRDPVGAPLNQAGVNVTVQIASGGGSLGGKTNATSNESGVVKFTDLSVWGETGARTLIFAADGFTPTTSASIDVTAGKPDPGQSAASVPNGTAGAPTALAIRLKDEFGNRVSGAAGAIQVTIDGANPSPGLPVSDDGNGSYSATYTPSQTGTDAVTVLVRGSPVGGSPFQSVVAAGAADAGHTTAALARSGFFGIQLDAVVTTRDSQGNPVGHGGDQITIQVNGGTPAPASDRGDGTYVFSGTVGFNQVSVTIFLNGVAIAGSPFVI